MTDRFKLFLSKPIVPAILVFVLSTLYFSSGTSLFGPFNYDEAVYTEVSREMISSGDYILPTYNYNGFYEKPPLLYWTIILVNKIFPFSKSITHSARFVQALAGGLTALFVYLFAFYITKSSSAGILSSVVFATSFGEGFLSRAILTDGIFAMSIAGALFCGFIFVETGNKKFSFLFWLLNAVAVLTKGPAGLVITAAAIVIAAFLRDRKEFYSVFRIFTDVVGLIIFGVVALSWYVSAYLRSGGGAVSNFLVVHNLRRFADVPFEGHSGPFFYYLPVIIMWFFPWGIFIIPSIINALKEKKDIIRHRYLMYCIAGAAVPFVIFSFSKTKLPNYIAPVFPFLCVLIGYFLSEKFFHSLSHLETGIDFRPKVLNLFIGLIPGVILIIIFGFLPSWLNMNIDRFISDMPFVGEENKNFYTGLSFVGISVSALILTILSIFVIFCKKFCRKVMAVMILMAIIIGLLIPYAARDVWNWLEKPLMEISVDAGNLKRSLFDGKEDGYILAYKLMMSPSIVFYSREKINFISENDIGIFSNMTKRNENFCLIAVRKDFDKDMKNLGLKILRQSGGYVLASRR